MTFNMRPLLRILACLLFVSFPVYGQFTIGAEQETPLLKYKSPALLHAAPAMALARDRVGLAAAWSMVNADRDDRIFVARMDARGRIGEDFLEMPITRPGVEIDAVYPALAASPSGEGFILAWLEITRGGKTRSAYCRLDRDLKPSTPESLPSRPDEPPPLLTHGTDVTWLVASDDARAFRIDGTIEGPYNIGPGASDIALQGDSLRVAGATRIHEVIRCQTASGCSSGGPISICRESCKVYRDEHRLRLLSLFTRIDQTSYPFDTETKPSVETIGDASLLAWFHGDQRVGGNVVAASDWSETAAPRILGAFSSDSGPTRPDIGADDERYVVAWRTRIGRDNHDIVGAVVGSDGTVTPLSIAVSSADERDPSVLALGNDTFLVAYEKIVGDERRIATRTVTLCCPRRRAVN